MLDSGNADLDALTYGQNLQNQQYNGWLDRLGGLVSPEVAAAGGAAGNQTNIANLYQGDATNRIGLQGNYESGLVGANNLQAARRICRCAECLLARFRLLRSAPACLAAAASGLRWRAVTPQQ